jgi:hypothetical protein
VRIKKVDEASEANRNEILNINPMSYVFCAKAAVPPMRRDGGGAIVNAASVRSVVAGGGNLQYDTTKAAIAGLTRGLAADRSAEGIRVNAVGPGPIFPPFHARRAAASGQTIEQYNAKAAQGTMMKRLDWAEEFAAAILFLASNDASYVTGVLLFVDGGPLFDEGRRHVPTLKLRARCAPHGFQRRLTETATIGRPESPGIGETITARQLGDRGIRAAEVQLRAHHVQPDGMQRRQGCGVAELAEHPPEGSNAAARRIRHLFHADGRVGIGSHEIFGAPHVERDRAPAPVLQLLLIIVRKTLQHNRNDQIGERGKRDRIVRDAVSLRQISHEEVELSPEAGGKSARPVESGFELKR